MRNNHPNNSNRSAIRNLSIITVLSIAIGIVIFFIIVLWAFPTFSFRVSEPANWSLLEGFTSVLSLSLLAGGLVFAVSEYINTENAKLAEKLAEERENAKISYEIYNAIYVKLTDPIQEAARRWILSNISIKKDDEDLVAWYEKTHAAITAGAISSVTGLPEGQHAIKQTLNCFDYIGFIASHYWKVDDDSMNWISAPVAKVWRRIGPYVLHVRTLRKTTDYYLSAQSVGDLCVAWREKKGLPDEEIAVNTP